MKRLLMIASMTFAGCSSGPNAAVADGGVDALTDAPAQSPLGFTPSNIDLSGMDLSKVGDVIITGPNCGVIDPEALTINCTDNGAVASKMITFADQSRMAVFVVKSLRVEASAVMEVRTGHVPFALVALETMTFFGSLETDHGTAGGAFNTQSETKGSGPGGGNSGPASNKAAGTGASYCGLGGAGTVEAGGTPYTRVAAYGTPELVPLLGGSAGGSGATPGTGHGGGAIQLVAGKSIDVKPGAFIAAPGAGGGQGGLASSQESSGGGSGGAILLEAPTVTIAGVLAVNGGGGGEGAGGNAGGGKSGDDGHVMDSIAASGGAAGTGNHGGNGGAGDNADGTDGVSDGTASASGGGGGAGRIRINTSAGSANLAGATLSPSVKTTCVSQGKLKP